MARPTQEAPQEGGAPPVSTPGAPAVFTPHACCSSSSSRSSNSNTNSSSNSSSSSSKGGLLSRQVTVGIRFRPPARSPVSPARRVSPPSSEAPPNAPVAAAASQSAGGSSGEGCGGPSSSTSSLPGPPSGASLRGPSSSRELIRRPPWARRGPTDEDWGLVDGEASGWVLVAPWALDLGAPCEEACSEGSPPSLARGPPRVWDGYKDVCYEADHVFGPEASNAEVYVHLVKDLVSAALNGRNAAFLAYGQTASGKTHTMFGGGAPTRSSIKGVPSQRGGPSLSSQGGGPSEGPPPSLGHVEKGVTELALTDIFEEQKKLDEKEKFTVSLSMLEVYQETVYDVLLGASTGGNPAGGPPSQSAGGPLLESRQKRSIALCEAPDGSLNMGSLGAHKVGSLSEALALVNQGLQQRQAASTALNPRSSRSHAVLRIILTFPPPAAAAAAAPPAAGNSGEVAAAAGGAPAGSAAAATTTAAESGAAAAAEGALPKAAAAATAGGPAAAAGEGLDACRSGSSQGPLKPSESLADGDVGPPSSRGPRRPSVLSLVDLAGAEGAGVAATVGKMQREGGAINRSLLALSRVVKALTRQQQQQQQQQQQEAGVAQADSKMSRSTSSLGALQGPPLGVGRPHRQGAPPFLGLRESKLTRLLSDCLGGPCLTSLLCLCAPGGPSYRRTAATLAFARRARRLPPAQEGPPHEGPPKLKRLRTKQAPNPDTAATAAAGGSREATEAAEGAGEGCLPAGGGAPQSTGAPGGPPRPFVYLPTGCVQCHALHKALKEAREELACQAVQLRQLRYVISRTPPLAAAAAAVAAAGGATPHSSSSSSSSSSRGQDAIGDMTPRRKDAMGESRTDEGGPQGAPLQRTPSHPHQENQTPKHVLLPPLNYGGGVCYKPPLPGSLGPPSQDKRAPSSLMGGPPPATPADSHKALIKGPRSGV